MLGAYYPGEFYPGESGPLGISGKLTIHNAQLNFSSDNLKLVENFTLAVDDASINLSSEVPICVVSPRTENANIQLRADNVSLSQKGNLGIQDASIVIQSDGITLTQKNKLKVNNADIALTSRNINTIPNISLTVNGVSLLIQSSAPSIIEDITLSVDDGLLSLLAENTSLKQRNILSIDDVSINIISSNVVVRTQVLATSVYIGIDSENVSLVQNSILTIDDSFLILLADNAEVIKFTPPIPPYSSPNILKELVSIDRPKAIISGDTSRDHAFVSSRHEKPQAEIRKDQILVG